MNEKNKGTIFSTQIENKTMQAPKLNKKRVMHTRRCFLKSFFALTIYTYWECVQISTENISIPHLSKNAEEKEETLMKHSMYRCIIRHVYEPNQLHFIWRARKEARKWENEKNEKQRENDGVKQKQIKAENGT